MSFWSDDKIETLKSLWPNQPAAAIAEAIGATRNQVLGKAHRIGLIKKQTPQEKTDAFLRPWGRRCEFPFGDPGDEGFHFCDKKTKGGSPYCAEHRAQCYRKKEDIR